MNIVAIIPAREGSKRLKHKNIYPIKGKPLIEYTIDAALRSTYINKSNLYISTDFDKVKDLGAKRELKVISRPEHLSGDTVWTQDVINHVDDCINKLEDEDIIIILQANSPQMTSDVIDKCVEMLIQHKLWQVHTVDENFIHNGAIQVMKRKVSNHKGKVNYNGVIKTDWIDVHVKEDIETLENIL